MTKLLDGLQPHDTVAKFSQTVCPCTVSGDNVSRSRGPALPSPGHCGLTTTDPDEYCRQSPIYQPPGVGTLGGFTSSDQADQDGAPPDHCSTDDAEREGVPRW